MRKVRWIAPAMLCAAAFSAQAAGPAVQPCVYQAGTSVTLPVTATVELPNDQAVVSFYTMEVDKDLKTATKKVIERVNKGLTELKALNLPVEFETQSMSSYPRYNQPKDGANPEIVGWEVRQNISGTVTDVSAAAPVAQKVGEHFAFERVNFTLSREAKEKVQSELMKSAVEQARRQANEIAVTLGESEANVHIESLDFNASNIEHYSNRMYAMAAKSAMADGAMPLPAFEPGKTTVSRSLTARVRIGAPAPRRPARAY